MATPRSALLLVNLGTPDAPTPRAVRRYLAEFLHDRRVVQLTRWLWCPLLHGLILPLRGPPVARKYAQVWMPGGSPLAVHTRALADAVATRLPGMLVRHAMRYGQPALPGVMREVVAAGASRVLVLPLYPQYSTSTTASVEDVVERVRADGALRGATVHAIRDYHVDAGWIGAVAASIRRHQERHGRGERLLLSFHGLPQRLVDAGDPYAAQCEASTAAIAGALGLPRDAVCLTYQSRFGRERWLQPATLETVQRLAREGVKTLDVACPGFAVDCLETLEEIAIVNAQAFRAAGGEALRYIPCLNADAAHAEALAAIAARAWEAAA